MIHGHELRWENAGRRRGTGQKGKKGEKLRKLKKIVILMFIVLIFFFSVSYTHLTLPTN